LGWRPLGAVLHSSNEPGELAQWLCHDDSTINIVLDITIIIIITSMKKQHFVDFCGCVYSDLKVYSSQKNKLAITTIAV